MDISRRRVGIASTALATPKLLTACADSGASYEDTARALWQHVKVDGSDAAAVRRELVRCATLAPSSHNTQCWKFALEAQAITILPDLMRRCPAVDPDDHHLHVSLGCAAENLAQAALAHGLKAEGAFDATRNALRLALQATAALASPLYQAIPQRKTTRAEYDAQALSADDRFGRGPTLPPSLRRPVQAVIV